MQATMACALKAELQQKAIISFVLCRSHLGRGISSHFVWLLGLLKKYIAPVHKNYPCKSHFIKKDKSVADVACSGSRWG
jgi:hypothetical protein